MLVKTQSKIKTKLIIQHPIVSPPYSHNEIVDTGATKNFVTPNMPLIKKYPPPSCSTFKFHSYNVNTKRGY